MSESSNGLLEEILNECAASLPNPWYPSQFLRTSQVTRPELEEALDRLRLAGLVRLTDWVSGTGQGYTLTEDGQRTVANPRALDRVRSGRLERLSPTPKPQLPTGFLAHLTSARGEVVRNALFVHKPPIVTSAILLLNVLVFSIGLSWAIHEGMRAEDYLVGTGAMQLRFPGGITEILHTIGGLQGSDLVEGEWWRLLSCCFVHFGFIHLAVNMLSVWVVGRLLEQMWSPWRYLVIYLVSGLGGSCAAMMVNPLSFLAGASGAIWGLMISMPVWVYLNRHYLPAQLVGAWMRRMVFLILINVAISFAPYISSSAHFGGGAVGMIAAILMTEQRFGRGLRSRLALVGVILLPALCLLGLALSMAYEPVWKRLRGIPTQAQEAERIFHEASEKLTSDVLPKMTRLRQSLADPADVRAVLAGLAEVRGEYERTAELLRSDHETDRSNAAGLARALETVQSEIRKLDSAAVTDVLGNQWKHLATLSWNVFANVRDLASKQDRVVDWFPGISARGQPPGTATTIAMQTELASLLDELAEVQEQYLLLVQEAGPFSSDDANSSKTKLVNNFRTLTESTRTEARRMRLRLSLTRDQEIEQARMRDRLWQLLLEPMIRPIR